MEENGRTGAFIRQLRKERGMTQKELAAALNVTDKAVSKWELGSSLPDVALLLPLSEILGVSVTELLRGVRTPVSLEGMAETPPQDTAGDLLSYTRRTASQRLTRLRLRLFAGLSGGFLLAALVCWICDMALHRALTWSLIVFSSLALAWAVILPLCTLRRDPVDWSLAALSAGILPYLCLLSRLLEDPRVFRFSLPMAPMAIGYLWGVRMALRRYWNRKWLAGGAVLLLTGILQFAVNLTLRALAPGELSGSGTLPLLLLSAACFLTEYVLRQQAGTA